MNPIEPVIARLLKPRLSGLPHPKQSQLKHLYRLLTRSQHTVFGKDHQFSQLLSSCTYENYKSITPLRSYAEYERGYGERAFAGEPNIIVPGIIPYFLQSGGTTSREKYLPLTPRGIQSTKQGSFTTTLVYTHTSKQYHIYLGKWLFVVGSHQPLNLENGRVAYRLSGFMVSKMAPFLDWLFLYPRKKINAERHFPTKMKQLARSVIHEHIRTISSNPAWLVELLTLAREHAELSPEQGLNTIWKHITCVFYSGTTIEPYREPLRQLLHSHIDFFGSYASAEGYFACQVSSTEELYFFIPSQEIFYEFVPFYAYGKTNPPRLPLWEVEKDVDYVVYVSTPNGLFSYCMEDIIQFKSTFPHQFIITGRSALFLNVAGEHLGVSEVEQAVSRAATDFQLIIPYFTWGPAPIRPHSKHVGHEWVFANTHPPNQSNEFVARIEAYLMELNPNYKIYRGSGFLAPPLVRWVSPRVFTSWLERKVTVDVQSKIPPIKNDRSILDTLPTN
jgi:hypothetical protein